MTRGTQLFSWNLNALMCCVNRVMKVPATWIVYQSFARPSFSVCLKFLQTKEVGTRQGRERKKAPRTVTRRMIKPKNESQKKPSKTFKILSESQNVSYFCQVLKVVLKSLRHFYMNMRKLHANVDETRCVQTSKIDHLTAGAKNDDAVATNVKAVNALITCALSDRDNKKSTCRKTSENHVSLNIFDSGFHKKEKWMGAGCNHLCRNDAASLLNVMCAGSTF